eukprot:GHVU01179450.1.p1 GENE.GHVU01179450.1~~GHVU01179450.1.p1  ORF type:complete len:105 (-),score=0.41 GHVU01179450.1:213-527(-)
MRVWICAAVLPVRQILLRAAVDRSGSRGAVARGGGRSATQLVVVAHGWVPAPREASGGTSPGEAYVAEARVTSVRTNGDARQTRNRRRIRDGIKMIPFPPKIGK